MEPERAAFDLGAADAAGPGPGPGSPLFDRAPVPMWVFDRESLRFLAVNDAAVAKYGYSREEFLALTLADIHAPADVPRLRRESTPVHDASPVKGGEWKHRSKAGEIFDVETASTAVRFQGRDARMALAYDVSKRVREQHDVSVRYAVTRLLAESPGDITDKAMRVLCESFDLVELWQSYEADKILFRKTFWQRPDDRAISPVAAPIPLEPGAGTLAQTWISGQPAWIEDFGREPGYRDRVADLQRAGISEGIVFALRTREATAGVVALLSRGGSQRDAQTIELMRDLGTQIGQHVERCRAEEELRKSREDFRAVFDEAPMPYHEIDRNGVVVRVNRAECDLLGMSPSDMIGKPVWDFAVPEEREDSRASVGRKFAEGRVQPPHNRRYIAANGEERIFQIHERLIIQPDGEVTGIRTAMLDLTGAQESERKIKFQAGLLEQVGDAIITLDRDYRVTYCNEAAERLFGMAAGEALGTDYRSLVSVEPAASERQAVFAPVSERRFWKGEIAVTNRNGKRTVLDVSDSALRDQNGDLQGIIAILRDVTERKLAEDKIVWLASFPEQNPNPVMEIEVRSGLVRYVNPVARDLFPDLQRQGWTHPWLAGLEQLAEGLTRADEHEARRDVIVDDRYWARTIQYLPEARRVRVYGIDITERKRAEEALRQSQSQLLMAQKLESIGQLAAGIAHEINTPIQYIGDNATFLAEAFRDLLRFVEPHTELASALRNPGRTDFVTALEQTVQNVDVNYLRDEIPKATEQLLEGVAQVARIVRAMKEFSHPGPVEKAPVDINRAIESTVLISRNEWKYVAELTTDLDPELPPVPCVAGEFNQVILNLIVNAAYAIGDVVRGSDRKGSIRIGTRRDGEWVEVRVSDTGAGIPEDIRTRIFTPFFTTKEVGKGTGQGLAMAHAVIVKKHQGTIRFESEIGVGTTFVVRLPLQCVGEKP